MSTDPATVLQTVSDFLVRVKKGRDPFSAGGDLPQTVVDVLAFYEVATTTP